MVARKLIATLEQQHGACVELPPHQAIHEMDQCHRCAGFGETVSRLNAQEPAGDHENRRTLNMFLNIFAVHRNSTATEHGSGFRNPGKRS
jgi:hypothetical protein